MNEHTGENLSAGHYRIPFVSVLVLNFNGREYLDECLQSLLSQSYGNFEIIVIDNGSTDGSVDHLKERYKNKIRILSLSSNRGFTGGNNAGIKAAAGEYVALLNNDTEVEKDWLRNLVNCMQTDDRVGMVGSKVLHFFRRTEIDNTGHLMYPDGLNRGRGRLETDHCQFDEKTDILFPSACAALYKKKLFEDTGGFDERFFLYGDDTDIGLHAVYRGYRAVYCPKAVVYHRYSGTVGGYSLSKVFYVERNRVWLLIKYFPLRHVLVSPFFTFKRMIFHVYSIAIKKGAAWQLAKEESFIDIAKILSGAYWSALQGILEMIRKRRSIMKNKSITLKEFSQLLRKHAISAREIALKE